MNLILDLRTDSGLRVLGRVNPRSTEDEKRVTPKEGEDPVRVGRG